MIRNLASVLVFVVVCSKTTEHSLYRVLRIKKLIRLWQQKIKFTLRHAIKEQIWSKSIAPLFHQLRHLVGVGD